MIQLPKSQMKFNTVSSISQTHQQHYGWRRNIYRLNRFSMSVWYFRNPLSLLAYQPCGELVRSLPQSYVVYSHDACIKPQAG